MDGKNLSIRCDLAENRVDLPVVERWNHILLPLRIIVDERVRLGVNRVSPEELDRCSAGLFHGEQLVEVEIAERESPDAIVYISFIVKIGDFLSHIDAVQHGGVCVRHIENRRYAADCRRACAVGEVFLFRRAGITKMAVRIDAAGQHVESRGVARFQRIRVAFAQGGDAPVFHIDVLLFDLLSDGVDDPAALDGKIEHLPHLLIP